MSGSLSAGPAEFLLELGSAPLLAGLVTAPWGMPGAYPPGARPQDFPARVTAAVTVVKLSQRGWTGEPGDSAAPNVTYPPRLAEAPLLTLSIPILPESEARGTATAAEATLDNADGRLDQVAGDWSMVGRPAVLRRGPHRTLLRADSAEFVTVASLRVSSAAIGTTAPRIALENAAADLSLPVCATYLGTGGLEGDAVRTGQNRPLLLGIVPNMQPTQVLAAQLLYQISSAPLSTVIAVRDKGYPLQPGSNYADVASLLNGKPAAGTYDTCLAAGYLRLASNPQGMVTCDAQSAGDTSHGGIALSLLRGPGGITADRLLPATVSTLPNNQAGFLFTSGTVADALDRVLRSCAGWWGPDRLGRVRFGRLPVPGRATASLNIPRWAIQDAIDRFGKGLEEVAGSKPRWGQRLRYQILGQVQGAGDLLGTIAADPAQLDYYSTGYRTASRYDVSILSTFPAALNPEPLETGWRNEADALAQAQYLLDCHGVRRRIWQVPVGWWGHRLDVGQEITADFPRLAGQNWIVTSISGAGDDMEATLWG
ncbi:hypothetical protein [Roseomonas elaeocarpi]|uniref:Phage tail protein n=1 Tax=Roseomonas elaeocarpi TaxID=907779 RepID=A0ABV6K012_9PROT